MRVIEEETAAYFEKNYEKWARCWLQAAYGRRWMWFGHGGITIREGWEEHGPRMRRMMERNPAPNPSGREIRRENVNLRATGDMAWVTFDQYGPQTGDPVFDVPGLQKEMRILERHDGAWKIVTCCNLQRSLDHVRSPLIRVDAKGTVMWTNTAAAERLRSRDTLAVRSGHLRAVGRADDQRLQAAIRWAASRDDDPRSRVIAVNEGGLPVLFGGGHAEPTAMCWVIANSGMILVSINDQQVTEERLASAAVVFGISPAQLRLAALIVSGCDVVEAASRLKISANTARTHLRRMFEKTGVRSQPALVRVLLSFASQLA